MNSKKASYKLIVSDNKVIKFVLLERLKAQNLPLNIVQNVSLLLFETRITHDKGTAKWSIFPCKRISVSVTLTLDLDLQ